MRGHEHQFRGFASEFRFDVEKFQAYVTESVKPYLQATLPGGLQVGRELGYSPCIVRSAGYGGSRPKARPRRPMRPPHCSASRCQEFHPG